MLARALGLVNPFSPRVVLVVVSWLVRLVVGVRATSELDLTELGGCSVLVHFGVDCRLDVLAATLDLHGVRSAWNILSVEAPVLVGRHPAVLSEIHPDSDHGLSGLGVDDLPFDGCVEHQRERDACLLLTIGQRYLGACAAEWCVGRDLVGARRKVSQEERAACVKEELFAVELDSCALDDIIVKRSTEAPRDVSKPEMDSPSLSRSSRFVVPTFT